MEVTSHINSPAKTQTVVNVVKKTPSKTTAQTAQTGNMTNNSSLGKNVNFNSNGEDEKKREKYLTAKYGAHQMALIRKRLKVEMWIFDQLQELYEKEVSDEKVGWTRIWCKPLQTELPQDVDIDLDEILDIEDENQRKKFVRVSWETAFQLQY